MNLWLFLHLAGFVIWLGAGLALMFAGIAMQREPRAALGTFARLQAALHRTLIAPGAFLTIVSGLVLTFRLGRLAGYAAGLVVMQATGLVAALLVLLIALPTAVRLEQVAPEGPTAGYFDELRRRQKVIGMLHGALGLAALAGGAALRG